MVTAVSHFYMGNSSNNWLYRYAVLTALATLGLVGMGGLVTSHGVGMAVPDWPTSYGYNMFALPISTWFTGGIFHEHTHRLWASLVGVMVVALTRWLGGAKSRWPLMLIGAGEILVGMVLLRSLEQNWHPAGHFLAGIGGVVLLGGVTWFGNKPSPGVLPALGWWAFWLVQLQGLLGGLRVVLDAHWVGDVRMGSLFGIVHGCLGQTFLVLMFVIALLLGPWWRRFIQSAVPVAPGPQSSVRGWFVLATGLIFAQLLIGATMRHQHAGLAIPDFPLAYGQVWPDASTEAVARYNQQRVEVLSVNPITPFQIYLQMAHRIVALTIALVIGLLTVKALRSGGSAPEHRPLRYLTVLWLVLVMAQTGLGAWTIWSNKAADVATAHVVLGAFSLVTGAFGCIISFRRFGGKPSISPATAAANAAVSTIPAAANP